MNIYSGCTDIELIHLLKFKMTNEAAFQEIYARYNSLLFTYAYRKLQDREEAKDIVQEVFINLWNQRQVFDIQISLKGYFYKSVLNKTLNIFKHKNIIQEYINTNNYFIEISENSTDYLIREKDILALIDREIMAFPPRMREVYELKRKEFLSTREIAEKLNISELTVSTQIKRALKILKSKLLVIMYFI